MSVRNLLIICATAAALAAAPAKKQPVKNVVFSCKSSETSQFLHLLDQVTYLEEYYTQRGTPHNIVILSQGECAKYMLSDLDGTRWEKEETPFEAELKLDKLKSKVRFEECENTLIRMNIPLSRLREFVRTVPSATVRMVDLQHDGYAVITQ